MKDIPKLTKCGLVTAFKCVESVKMENVSKLGDLKALKEAVERRKEEEEEERRRKREEEERKRKEVEGAAGMARRKAVISCERDWDCVDKRVDVIEVSDGCCNEEGLKELDLSGFVNLKELKVGDECFENVEEVKLIGLGELESVVIGSKSFIRDNDSRGGSFHLKNCPKLRELRIIGVRSFEDYDVCEIENVDALEVIEIGDLNEWSRNFFFASLELKSILIHSK